MALTFKFCASGAFLLASIGQLIYAVAQNVEIFGTFGPFLQNSATFSGHSQPDFSERQRLKLSVVRVLLFSEKSDKL